MGNLNSKPVLDRHDIMNKYFQGYNTDVKMIYHSDNVNVNGNFNVNVNDNRHDHHKNKNFIITHQNIRGIKNKVEEFLISIRDIEPQIICLSEHHLKIDEIDNVNFNQYRIGNSFCRQTFNCGGVCILIRENLQFDTINLDQFNKEKDLESCAIKFQFMSKNFIIICIYRSPTGKFSYFLKQLELLLNSVYNTSNVIILCGDFNVNYLNDNSMKDSLNSLLASFNLYSTIYFPTRISYNSCTLIDNIYIDSYLHGFFVHPFINGLSDHDAQVLTLNIAINPDSKQIFYYRRVINNYTIGQIIYFLSYENWEDVFTEKNVNMAFNKFLNTFLRIFYACCPMKKYKYSHTEKSWLTTGIKVSCANKRKLYLISRSSEDPNVKEYFRKYCRILTKVITAAKKMYYNTLISESNNKTKTTWNIVKTITNNRGSSDNIIAMKIKDKSSCNPIDIVEAFNNYFSSIAKKLLNNNNNSSINNKDFLAYLYKNFSHPYPKINLGNTNAHEIQKIILSMKPKNSHGYDEISLKILKSCTPYIISPLTYLCNKILLTGIFPERLKYSEVRPLYKKGDKDEISNYRPISLLPTFSKIIEKIIYIRLYSHLSRNNILVKEQFGFRKQSSTEMATYNLLNNILTSLDKKNYVGGLFCDLQKAFDCVNHEVLLEKMNFYGISGIAIKLMSSYLENRYQRVIMKGSKFNKIFSKWERVIYGVPQGSILGPLLFLIYINDFPASLKNLAQPILFADDTSIIISNSSPEEFTSNIISVFKEIMIWFNRNFLTLNCDKTHFLQFFLKRHREVDIQIITTNSLITNINCSKFLGINIDSSLSWKNHITVLSSRLNKACFAIRSVKPFMSLDTMKMIYYAYVHSLLKYGIIFWGNAPLSVSIFKIQKRIIRIMLGLGKLDSCRDWFKKLQILPLQSQYIFSLLLFVINNKNYFIFNTDIHDINTRFNYNLHLPSTNLSIVQNGVLFSGSKIYNHLPSNIKLVSKDVKQFKSLLKSYLMEHAFYSIDEFYETTSQ
jgi:exonuclease III